MKRPASEMQEVNKDTQSATKMARFGNLEAQHLKLLDALPKSALPDRPPAGQHQYTLYMGMSVKVIVKLSAKVFVLCHVDNGRSRSFPFHEGDVSCVWDDVWTLATSWKHWPDLHCPPRAARQAAADPPLPASGSADQQLESAAAGPAPVSADDSETERFDGDCENSDSSDTSSSHWGYGCTVQLTDLFFAVPGPFVMVVRVMMDLPLWIQNQAIPAVSTQHWYDSA